MTEIQCVGFEEKYLDSYQRFARAHFGPTAYQAEAAYLTWLYQDNPHGASWTDDFPIAITNDGTVVGCVHNMKLPWRVGGQIRTVAAGHNLMVDQRFRSGVGLSLTVDNISRSKDLLISGIVEPLAYMYKRLGAQQIDSAWYRKVLKPLKGFVQVSLNKALNIATRPKYFPSHTSQNMTEESGGIRLETVPDAAVIEQIAAALNEHSEGRDAPYWDGELVRWRFFHPHGPRHLLVYSSSQPVTDFLIVSLGPRRSVNVGRIVGGVATSVDRLSNLVRHSEATIKRHGGSVLLTYCADPVLAAMFSQLGWRPMTNAPQTLIYHEQKNETFESCSFMGSAGDLGFEAIPRAA